MTISTASRDPDRIPSLLVANAVGQSSLVVTGLSLTNANPMHVAVVDAAGNQVTGFGGGSLATGPFNGQAKIAVTGTAVQLGSNALTNGVIISAKSTNAASITIGGSGVTNTVDGTGNGYILAAGASVSFAVTNSNVLYINGTAGDIISYAGS